MAKTWTLKFYDEGHFQYSQKMDNLNHITSLLKGEGFSYSHTDECHSRIYKNKGQTALVYGKGGQKW